MAASEVSPLHELPVVLADDENLAKNMLTSTRCEGGKSAWATTIESYTMQESKSKRGDVYKKNFDEALVLLKYVVDEKDIEIDTTALKPFGATTDDLLRVFVNWCFKEEVGKYNISKAARRLEDYVAWMEKNCKGFDYNPETMIDAHEAWGFFLTHDKQGRLVWWTDTDINDFDRIKNEVPYDDTLRYVVYMSHVVMFDEKAQKNGMVCVDQMGNKSVIEYLTMIPVELGTKLDRISVGILPIRIKKLYLFNCARWMFIIAGLMAPFASAKVRKRFCFLRSNAKARIKESLGQECIPKQIHGLDGKKENDILSALIYPE